VGVSSPPKATGLSKFFEYPFYLIRTAKFAQVFKSTPYYLRNGWSYTNFKVCTHIHGIDRNKSPLKISEK